MGTAQHSQKTASISRLIPKMFSRVTKTLRRGHRISPSSLPSTGPSPSFIKDVQRVADQARLQARVLPANPGKGPSFKPGYSVRDFERDGVRRVGPGGVVFLSDDNVASAVHELGHVMNRRRLYHMARRKGITGLAGRWMTAHANAMRNPSLNMAVDFGVPVVQASGVLDPDSTASKVLSWIPLLASSPVLAGEATASVLGQRRLAREFGVRGIQKNIRMAVGNLGAYSTYAVAPMASSMLSHAIRGIRSDSKGNVEKPAGVASRPTPLSDALLGVRRA